MENVKKKQRKRIFNIIMIAVAAIIVIAAIMLAGNLQGWFDAEIGTDEAMTENVIGSVSIQRRGIAYSLEDGMELREGDLIETTNGSSVDLILGEGTVSLGQNTEALYVSRDKSTVELIHGEIFVNVDSAFTMKLTELKVDISALSGVFSVSAPAGSANVYVYENEIAAKGMKVSAGQGVSFYADSQPSSVKNLSAAELNDFIIQKAIAAGRAKTLCFTNEQLNQISEEREKASKAVLGQQYRDDSSNDNVCSIIIRCDEILENMDDLKEGKNKYVPQDGTILNATSIEFEEGETVFDILARVCENADIQLEYSWVPLYDSYYVEGINNLYEFDCGKQSGWQYEVNGWSPNYGCSSYTIKSGDAIVWSYTCEY